MNGKPSTIFSTSPFPFSPPTALYTLWTLHPKLDALILHLHSFGTMDSSSDAPPPHVPGHHHHPERGEMPTYVTPQSSFVQTTPFCQRHNSNSRFLREPILHNPLTIKRNLSRPRPFRLEVSSRLLQPDPFHRWPTRRMAKLSRGQVDSAPISLGPVHSS